MTDPDPVPFPSSISPTVTRPALLVSVRDTDECEAAITGGADWIDIKEPANGPLGAASAQTMTTVLSFAQQRGYTRVSAALGDLPDASPHWPDELSLVKIGFAGLSPANARSGLMDWWQTRSKPNRTSALVLTAYADHHRCASPSPEQLLDLATHPEAPPIRGLLIDTAIKDGRGLFDWIDQRQLQQLITAARSANLFIALAGSLRGDTFAQAAHLRPDLIAVRGAACEHNDRTSRVTAAGVANLRMQLQALPPD